MDVVKFKRLVNKYGGEDKVASIVFNNAYRQIFSSEQFSFSKHIDEEEEHFIFKIVDPLGVECTIIKPVEYVEGIVFVKDVEDFKKLSTTYIGG